MTLSLPLLNLRCSVSHWIFKWVLFSPSQASVSHVGWAVLEKHTHEKEKSPVPVIALTLQWRVTWGLMSVKPTMFHSISWQECKTCLCTSQGWSQFLGRRRDCTWPCHGESWASPWPPGSWEPPVSNQGTREKTQVVGVPPDSHFQHGRTSRVMFSLLPVALMLSALWRLSQGLGFEILLL